MSIVCSICGGTDVKCAAVVDPNTKEFLDFGYEAFLDGQCDVCGNVPLTDPDEVQADIEKLWAEHLAKHGKTPSYAYCEVVHLNHEGSERRFIRIGNQTQPEPTKKVFAYCDNLAALKALAVPNLESGREFTVIGINAFATKIP